MTFNQMRRALNRARTLLARPEGAREELVRGLRVFLERRNLSRKAWREARDLLLQLER